MSKPNVKTLLRPYTELQLLKEKDNYWNRRLTKKERQERGTKQNSK